VITPNISNSAATNAMNPSIIPTAPPILAFFDIAAVPTIIATIPSMTPATNMPTMPMMMLAAAKIFPVDLLDVAGGGGGG
jgi:hypothetical protein